MNDGQIVFIIRQGYEVKQYIVRSKGTECIEHLFLELHPHPLEFLLLWFNLYWDRKAMRERIDEDGMK